MTDRLIVAILLLAPAPVNAGGLGTVSKIICSKSCQYICKSPFVPRILEMDAKAETTKVFAAIIGTSTIDFIDKRTGERFTFSPDDPLKYNCEEQP